jgi:hypothetical protein
MHAWSSNIEDDEDEQAIVEQDVRKMNITAATTWDKHDNVTREEVLALACSSQAAKRRKRRKRTEKLHRDFKRGRLRNCA